MLRKRPAILWLTLCATLLPLLSIALCAQEFSADFVDTGKKGAKEGPTRIYVGKDKMRFDASDRGEYGSMAMIIDFANHKSLILMPSQKMYMESKPGMGPKQQNMWFRPEDPNNACPQFESMVKQHNPKENVSCHKVGPDVVNGRSTIKYAGGSSNGTGYVWIDPSLRFVVKWEDDKGNVGELRNIKEGRQDASLFEIPSGYQKFDMQMMQRGRQPQ